MSTAPVLDVEDVVEDAAARADMSRDEVAAWACVAPVPEVFAALIALDPETLSQGARIDRLAALRRVKTFIEAQEHRTVASTVAHAPESASKWDRDGREWVREEIACALSIPPDSARAVMCEGVAVVEQFPATLALLEDARITPGHVSALVATTASLDDAVAAKVEARVIGRAPEQSVANYRRSLTRAVAAIDPSSAAQQHERSRADRAVYSRAQDHGMSQLGAYLPAEDVAVIETALDCFADRTRHLHDDDRTKAQLRADGLAHIARCYLNGNGSDGTGNGSDGPRDLRPAVSITIGLETLLGLNDLPGELDGYGPITAAAARKIAADPSGTWRRLITDKAGKLLDYQQTKYKPPKALDEHVRQRDRRCRFPKCKRRARHCDLDHRHDWQHGGTTCAINLECLCERHHALKHDAGWQLTGNPESTLTWTSPTGHSYTSNPPPQPIAEPPPVDDDLPPF